MTHDARATQRTPRRPVRTSRQRHTAQSARKTLLAAALRFLTNAALGLSAFGFVSFGGADAALRAIAPVAPTHHSADPAFAPTLTWDIDVDADGVADFANPTHAAIRGVDAFGSGRFGAQRDKGRRKHLGVDYVAAPGAPVHAPISGQVRRIGYAYRGNTTLRYIEIANPQTHLVARVLYIAPAVAEGDEVIAGEQIGAAQNLTQRYPGITNHVHIEMRNAAHRFVDASTQLPAAPMLQAASARVAMAS